MEVNQGIAPDTRSMVDVDRSALAMETMVDVAEDEDGTSTDLSVTTEAVPAPEAVPPPEDVPAPEAVPPPETALAQVLIITIITCLLASIIITNDTSDSRLITYYSEPPFFYKPKPQTH